MLFRRTVAGRCFVSLGAAVLLAGCATTPLSPTVQVTPGRGKSAAQFQADDNYCRQYSGDQVKGLVNSANSQAVAAMLASSGDEDDPAPAMGASQQSNIQVQYDRAYGRCMYANQNIVPGYGPRSTRTARPVHRTAPASADADKASASAPAASTWVAPTSSSSPSPSSGSGSSSSGAGGWVAPAKTQ